MKSRRVLKLRSLKTLRIRQSWNKYNVYQMNKFRVRNVLAGTFFQQKWYSKSISRIYHGEHIKERTWTRMFSRRLLSAVNMDPTYMAKYDGSEQAEGRGSGKQTRPGVPPADRTMAKHLESTSDRGLDGAGHKVDMSTPYMHMTFAPMERRLDIAVFRALFASSARQARQLVVHGNVMVNGQKMRYPGYLLNPGDMFQVDPDKVMMCTGKPKTRAARVASGGKKAASKDEGAEAIEDAEEATEEAAEGEAAEAVVGETVEAKPADPPAELTPEEQEAEKARTIKSLQSLIKTARRLAADARKDQTVGAKAKQRLRAFLKDVKTAMSKSGHSQPGKDRVTVQALSDALSDLTLSTSGSKPLTSHTPTEQAVESSVDELTFEEEKILNKLMWEEERNPLDLSKPYRTPWQPKTYMPAFAFIPRYLQVNQKICSAVYLRHPVARPGRTEIPTPFPLEIAQLAHNWYLRRR